MKDLKRFTIIDRIYRRIFSITNHDEMYLNDTIYPREKSGL